MRLLLSPLWIWERVDKNKVREAFRLVFERWGMPERIRFDNGKPWGTHSDLPSELAMWLLGLGVVVIFNRPHHPQENSKVERSHGTVKPWVEAENCKSIKELQKRLERACLIQREKYIGVDRLTRLERYPELREKGKPYSIEKEEQMFDLERVCNYLSQGVWQRKVNGKGYVSLFNRYYKVGLSYAKQSVNVKFIADTKEWVVFDQSNTELIRHKSLEITAERVRELNVSRPHSKKKNKGA